jgi:hypothetical protein
MGEEPLLVAVLGDVVASRHHPSRSGLREALDGALGVANSRTAPLQPLTPTIGDEFQGLYTNLAAALEATLLVRLSLVGLVDVRFGVGHGALTAYHEGRAPFEQDGPAWWAARAAVERAKAMSRQQEMPRGVRTVYVDSSLLAIEGSAPVSRRDAAGEDDRRPEGTPGNIAGLVNAFLMCRDELVAPMDARDAETMLHLLEGETLSMIANMQDVTLSAVSQRAISGGMYALRKAHEELRETLG